MNWRATAPDLELAVSCDGARHRITWSQGSVELPDHPDLAAERALIALGGPEPACLAHLRLWQHATIDGGFLAEWIDENHLTDARLSWLGTALERMRLEGFNEFLRHLPPARAERMGHFIHRFPRPWIDRAACEVAEALDQPATGHSSPGESDIRCRHAAGLLEQAVANRLRRAFVDSVGGNLLSWGAAALVPLDITVDPKVAPTVSGRLTGPARGVRVAVAPRWLHQVWGAGAPLIDGRLVLAFETEAGGSSAPTPEPLTRAALAVWGEPDVGGTVDPVTTGGANRGVAVAVEWRWVEHADGRWRLCRS